MTDMKAKVKIWCKGSGKERVKLDKPLQTLYNGRDKKRGEDMAKLLVVICSLIVLFFVAVDLLVAFLFGLFIFIK